MATIVYGLNQSLDGYVDHTGFAPGPGLFKHFIEQTRARTGCLYGRGMYEVMRYWDDEQPEWDDAERAFADAWCSTPKWVASSTLTSLGPNATLIGGDLESAVRDLKAEQSGEIEVAGPVLAASLMELGLVDEIVVYLHPVVVGGGAPFFAGVRPSLRLVASEEMGEGVVRLTYASV